MRSGPLVLLDLDRAKMVSLVFDRMIDYAGECRRRDEADGRISDAEMDVELSKLDASYGKDIVESAADLLNSYMTNEFIRLDDFGL